MDDPKPTPSMVLAAYAERLIEGRRVVVFGDSTSGLAEHLVDRGARLVHVYDPDPRRVAEATTRGAARNISFAPLGQTGIAVRDGAFDVGLVDNLATCLSPNEHNAGEALVRRLRRALAARGVALIVTPNPEAPLTLLPAPAAAGPTYYELYDLVCAEFDEVRMLGQTPFVGYAVAEFNPEEEDEYSIDTGFVPGGAEEPEYYIALASHFPVSVDSFSVIQLPAEGVLPEPIEEMPDTSNSEELRSQPPVTMDTGAQREARIAENRDINLTRRTEEAEKRALEAERKASAIEQELEKTKGLLQQAKEAEKKRARERASSDQNAELLKQAQAELAKRDQWVQELENRASTADARADEVQAELEQTQEALAEANRELHQASAEREAEAQRAAAVVDSEALDREVQNLKRRVEQLLGKLDESKAQLESADETNRDLSADLGRLESQLRERGAEVARLTKALRKTEAFGEQLIRELADARESATNGSNGAATSDLQAKLSKLAETDARRAADLTAAQWTIRELETKLRHQEAEASPELAAELEQAQAEIQRQATLIQQFRNKS